MDNGRYKAKFTDGSGSVDGVLSSQLASRAESGEVKTLSVVTLKEFNPNVVRSNSCNTPAGVLRRVPG